MNYKKVLFPKEPILVVDDLADFLRSFKATLRTNGINNVTICQDSREVLTLLDRTKYSLILLDYMMPKVTGPELLDKINEYFPHIPVIMLTACNEYQKAFECMKKGAVDYIFKEEEPVQIVEKVLRALIPMPSFIELEAAYFKMLLHLSDQNQTRAARVAGIPRETLISRIRKVESSMEKPIDTAKDLCDLFRTNQLKRGQERVRRR